MPGPAQPRIPGADNDGTVGDKPLDCVEVRREAVVEVRGAGGEAPQDRALEPADVLLLAVDQGAAGVGVCLSSPVVWLRKV